MKIKISGDEFLDYIIDTLSSLYEIKARKMFGGYGLYINAEIFALIIKKELYFKANKKTSAWFMQFDSEPFSYKRNGKLIKLSYWKVPPEVLENQALLEQWLRVSLEDSLCSALIA